MAGAADGAALRGESPALGVGEAQAPTAEMLTQDAVLLLEVRDDLGLVAVHPAREHHEQAHSGGGLALASDRGTRTVAVPGVPSAVRNQGSELCATPVSSGRRRRDGAASQCEGQRGEGVAGELRQLWR